MSNYSVLSLLDWDSYANGGSLLPLDNNVQSTYVKHDDKYVAEVELPGFKRTDVKVEVDGAFVVVKATKGETKVGVRYILYTDVVVDEIGAVLEDGVLTITMPRQKARTIEVK